MQTGLVLSATRKISGLRGGAVDWINFIFDHGKWAVVLWALDTACALLIVRLMARKRQR